jgi:hypothetical protein
MLWNLINQLGGMQVSRLLNTTALARLGSEMEVSCNKGVARCSN